MRHLDRIGRSLFVAFAVGLGWGIRGDFGHQLGAMAPGALFGMAFVYVSGQDKMFRLLPLFAFVSALTLSLGGTMSYGMLHGYAQSPSFPNYTYGYVTLFLLGGAWGGPCGAAIGLLLENERVKLSEWAGATLTVLVYGVVAHAVIVNLIGFHINPPRSDISVAFFGGMAGLFVWLRRKGKRFGLKGAFYGFIGFGVGMSLARFLGNLSYIVPVAFDNWKVMEISCGAIGGFITAYALLGKELKSDDLRPWVSAVGYVGVFFVMLGIPLLHWIQRIAREDTLSKIEGLKGSLLVANPDTLASGLLVALVFVQVFAFAGAVTWMILQIEGKGRFVAFPVLCFATVMLIECNIRGLFPFVSPNYTQAAFWTLYLLMALFVLVWRRRPLLVPADRAVQLHCARSLTITVLIFTGMLAANAPIDDWAGRYGFQRPDGARNRPGNNSNTRFPLP